jgi:hypothetical protein
MFSKKLIVGAVVASTFTATAIASDSSLKDAWNNSVGLHNERASVLSACSALASQLSAQNPDGNAGDVFKNTAFKTAEMATGILIQGGDQEQEAVATIKKDIAAFEGRFNLVINDVSLDATAQAKLKDDTLFCVQFNALSSTKPNI